MPHKHKRQKLNDGAAFDLPPTAVAKALPAFQKPSKTIDGPSDQNTKPAKTKTKTKTKIKTRTTLKAPIDDTPKSFARLMQFHTLGKRLPKGLDDGSNKKKNNNINKRKQDSSLLSADNPTIAPAAVTQEANAPLPLPQADQIPRIQPGERLSDFAARVDQALPITGLRSTDKQRAAKVPGLKERTTKHNKRLERMQKGWREVEQRRKEKLEEEMDELEDQREEDGLLWNSVQTTKGKKKKRIVSGGGGGPDGGEDDDPWKALEKIRAETKQRNLQDVVQAPPVLKQVKSRFKEVSRGSAGSVGVGVGVDVGNVPGSVGSLRKREEMAQVRRRVIDGYRKRMGRGRDAKGKKEGRAGMVL